MIPDSATSATVVFCCAAMNPSTEKTANPPTRLVPLLTEAMIKQSLENTDFSSRYSDIFKLNACISNMYLKTIHAFKSHVRTKLAYSSKIKSAKPIQKFRV